MNRYKNCHYKSAVQFYNTATQPFVATDIVTSPLLLNLGNIVTDTGVAIDFNASGATIENSGLYRVSADVSITGIVAGDAYTAITINGVVLPETLKRTTLAAGDTVVIPLETIRNLKTCCNLSSYVIGIIVYSDATATGTVSDLSGNIVKLA